MNHKALNIAEAIAAVILLFAFHFIVGITFYDAGIVFGNGDPKSSVISVLATGALITVLMKITKTSYSEIFHSSQNSILSTVAVLTPLISLIIIAGSWWYYDLMALITTFLPEDKSSIAMLENIMNGGFVTVVAICLIAPFTEEMLFRGIILRGFLQNYSPIKSILISSLLFSLVHLNLYQIPSAFILGCFMGWLYYISRSLWPSIIAHTLNNATVYVMYILWPSDEYNHVVLNATSFVVSLIGILAICKVFKVQIPLSFFRRKVL